MRAIDKIINVKVRGDHLTKDNRNAGVQHEANVTYLRIDFDEGWDPYAKTVTFWDALMGNPTKLVMTTDKLEDIHVSHRVYMVPIPGEALGESGDLTFVVDGWVDGKRKRSLADTLYVKPAPFEEEADEPTDPTPSQAEQMQVQLDQIISDIQKAEIAASDAFGYAEYARGQADNATSAAQYSQEMADYAYNMKEAAVSAQGAAEAAKTAAAASAAAAKASETNAAKSEATATAGANTASTKADEAAASASTATNKAGEAASSATNAKHSENNAEIYRTSAYENAVIAKNASTAAQASATNAASSAAAAAKSAAEAQQAAGGDFVTPAQAQGMADTAEANAKAYAVAKAGDTMTGDLTISKAIAKQTLKATDTRLSYLMKNANANVDMGLTFVDDSDGKQVRLVLRAADQKLVFVKDTIEYELYGKHNLTASGLGAVQATGDTMTGILTFDTPGLFSAIQKKRTVGDANYMMRIGVGSYGTGGTISLRLVTVGADGTETGAGQFDIDKDGLVWVTPGGLRKTVAHSGNIGLLTASVE